MVAVTVKFNPTYRNKLRKLPQKALEDAFTTEMRERTATIRRLSPVRTGKLKRSWFLRFVPQQIEARLINRTRYAVYVQKVHQLLRVVLDKKRVLDSLRRRTERELAQRRRRAGGRG